MKTKIYDAPRIQQVEFEPESCLATSTSEQSEVNTVNPDPWNEGNINWW